MGLAIPFTEIKFFLKIIFFCWHIFLTRLEYVQSLDPILKVPNLLSSKIIQMKNILI